MQKILKKVGKRVYQCGIKEARNVQEELSRLSE